MKSTAMLGWLLLWVSATWADSIPQIVARVKPAVVTVVTLDIFHHELCRGTGFFMSENTVVTNHHVLVCDESGTHGRYRCSHTTRW
jgi:hypothetical protein